MSNVWYTSDLHIGHEKIAKIRSYGHVLPRVVGAEIAWHDRMLARNWDETVGKDDTVWVLGDISSGTQSAQLAALEWIKQRPGHKHLIAGNHDGPHAMHRDSYKWLPRYLDGAFETVQLAARRRIPLAEGHVSAVLSHAPYSGDHTDEDRLKQWRLPDCGDYIIHGHTHSGWRLSRGGKRIMGQPMRINQIHIGVDAHDFKPVPWSWITETVQAIEDGTVEPALTWRYS